jgi:hypothetical protein
MSRSLAPALVNPSDIMEYDLDSNAVDRQGRALFLERFIHGETYKARSDVMAVIHSHSPAVIPFSISQTPLQPVFNGAAFLSPSVPVFDIRKVADMTDLLIGNGELGKALGVTLGQGAVALLRGHGNVVVGATVQQVFYRAIQTETQCPAAASSGDARRAVDLLGAGRSREGERTFRTGCHPDWPYLGTLEATNLGRMTGGQQIDFAVRCHRKPEQVTVFTHFENS